MAVISLNGNQLSIQTQRRLVQATSSLSKSYERLSSGLRVSRAADDAAGLAVASGLNVDARVFQQGLRNLSDGASLANIAEGALSELAHIVTRIAELAEQGANGTLGMKQRSALDAEAQALSKEFWRIAKTTEFNGLKLFDGSAQGLSLQMGYGQSGSLQSSVGGNIGTGQFKAPVTLIPSLQNIGADLADLNNDGNLDFVSNSGANSTVFLGNGDGTFRIGSQLSSTTLPSAFGDVNDDGILDYLTYDATLRLGNGDGSFKDKTALQFGGSGFAKIADLNQDGFADIVGLNTATQRATVLIGNGDGSFQTAQSYQAVNQFPGALALGDMNGDGALDLVWGNNYEMSDLSILLGKGDGSFGAQLTAEGYFPCVIALGDVNRDGALDIVSGNTSGGSIELVLGNGDGTFKASRGFQSCSNPTSLTLVDLNADGFLDSIVGNDTEDYLSIALGNGDGTLKATTPLTINYPANIATAGDLNNDGAPDLLAVAGSTVYSLLAQTQDGLSPLPEFSLKTKLGARQALPLFKQVLNNLSSQRGIIGANQSRLSVAISIMQVEAEHYNSAKSRIIDADIAAESAQMVKTQILQQAASAVLAQTNQAPALALALLRG